MISTPSTHPPLVIQSDPVGKDAIADDWQFLVGFMISATSATSEPLPGLPPIRRM